MLVRQAAALMARVVVAVMAKRRAAVGRALEALG